MKRIFTTLLSVVLLISISSCQSEETTSPSIFDRSAGNTAYQILIYAFDSSDGDGLGDFNGITYRLEYLQDLGISMIWLSPLHEAGSYHGYDVTDYYSVNSDYGTMDDFKELIDVAHQHGISVILDMVLNHTSSNHQWFKDACQNKNGKRDWYVWKKDGVTYGSGGGYTGKFYESSTCGGSYFSSFSASMPDLNLNNPEVVEEQRKILKFWLDLGVDGFRFDAIKHFFDVAEYDKNRDLSKDIDKYMKKINGFIHSYKKNSYIVGEYLEKDYRSYLKYAPYFDSEFDFYWYDRILNIASGSSGAGYIKDYNNAQEALKEVNKDWYNSVIISNHDHDRIMSQVGSVERAKLAASLQMLLPGLPFVYYGDEIGLKGARYNNNDIERRLPMKWGDTWYHINADNYGAGLYRKTINDDVKTMAEQQNDESSLYNHYKKLINFRNMHSSIYKGQLTNVDLLTSLIAYEASYENEKLLVIHNRTSNTVSIDDLESYQSIILNSELVQRADNKINIPAYVSIVIQL